MHIGITAHATGIGQLARGGASTTLAATCVMLTAAPAFALDSVRSQISPRHQMAVRMASCMRTQMSANKTIWYNDAARVCREKLDRQRDNATAGALVAADATSK